MKHNNRQDNVTQTAVAAIAAASQTPFKTAFKIYLGIGLAQLTMLAILGGLFVLAVGIVA